MSLFLINGSAGTGKSTVCQILKQKGYLAYDVDVDGFAKWINLETGYVHPKSSVKQADRTPEFLSVHRWHVPRKDILKLQAELKGKLGFLCGHLDNEDEVWDLFTQVFSLYVDDKTLSDRLSKRTGNDWGAQPDEIQRTIKRHHVMYDKYQDKGAIIIDSTQPPDQVVEKILSKTSQNS